MFKVRGLPIQITKSDLDELFSRFGKIQITETSIIIKIEEDESIAYVQLDKDENLAIEKLNKTRWRDNILRLNKVRADGIEFGDPGSGGTESEETGSGRESSTATRNS